MPKVEVVELPAKCRKCSMRRHRVGLVKECGYECPDSEMSEPNEQEKMLADWQSQKITKEEFMHIISKPVFEDEQEKSEQRNN